MCSRLAASGVTAFCPTVITSTNQYYHQVLPEIDQFMSIQRTNQYQETPWSQVLGIHLEGPFINSKKRGAHRLDFVQDRSKVTSLKQLIDCYGQLNNVRIVTFAPELFDDLVISQLHMLGIVPSIGHCCATLDQCKSAIRNGARCITHLFNAMPAFHHREPSVIGVLTMRERIQLPDVKPNSYSVTNGHCNGTSPSVHNSNKQTNGYAQMNGFAVHTNGFSSKGNEIKSTDEDVDKEQTLPDKLFYGIISDGVHTHESAVAMAFRTYPEGLILVTDAVAPLGLQSDQVHRLGTNMIEIKGHRAYINGTDTLCGSIAPLDACIRRFVASTECDPIQAINCATLHPAALLGLEGQKGDLSFGCDADFVLLSSDLQVQSTYIDGRLAWTTNKLKSS